MNSQQQNSNNNLCTQKEENEENILTRDEAEKITAVPLIPVCKSACVLVCKCPWISHWKDSCDGATHIIPELLSQGPYPGTRNVLHALYAEGGSQPFKFQYLRGLEWRQLLK